MQYRSLGRSGITVSSVCLGTMTFGEQTDEAEAHRQLDLALDAGVNFLDAAEAYPVPTKAATQGETERQVGRWLKARGGRDKVIVATKVVGRADRFPYLRDGKPRLDAKNVAAALDASLQRLQTDYVDLYQLHFPDRATNTFEIMGYAHKPDDDPIPIPETLAALGELVKAGKIRAVGVSNETPWGVMTFLNAAAADPALPRIAAIQNPYSLVNRAFDIGLAEMAIKADCPLLAYSPLGFGTLTGKYRGGARPPKARLTDYHAVWSRYLWPRAEQAQESYAALARKHGLEPTALALAFAAARPFMASVIVGARTAAQLGENLDLIERTRLSPEVLAEIDAIHALNPNPVLK